MSDHMLLIGGARGGEGDGFEKLSCGLKCLDLGNWEKKCMVEGGALLSCVSKEKKRAAGLVFSGRGMAKDSVDVGELDWCLAVAIP